MRKSIEIKHMLTTCDNCKAEVNSALTKFLHGYTLCIECSISFCRHAGIPYTFGFIEGINDQSR